MLLLPLFFSPGSLLKDSPKDSCFFLRILGSPGNRWQKLSLLQKYVVSGSPCSLKIGLNNSRVTFRSLKTLIKAFLIESYRVSCFTK